MQWGGALQAVFTVFQFQVTDVPVSGALPLRVSYVG